MEGSQAFETYAQSTSNKFSKMNMDVKEKKEKENEWIIRQLAIEEEKY